ncbi:MAG: hypothetical protein RL701_5464 [Pseudomonadota bacterium]
MKLKNKLTLIVAGVTLCTLALSFVLLGLLVHRDDIEDLDRALAKQAAKAMARGMGREGGGAIEDGWVEIPEMLDIVRRHAALYDETGKLLHATKSFEGRAPRFADLEVTLPLPAEGAHVDSGLHSELLRGIVLQVPGTDNVMLYAVSRSDIDHDAASLYRTLGLMLIIATGLVVVVARWLGERMAREVAAIAQVTRSVAHGDLKARVGSGFTSIELNHLAVDIDHMVEQLEAAISAQQRFIAHAAHELRSPLTTLRGELQLALRRPRETAEYRGALDRALDDVVALIALSEDLLTLARVQAEPRSTQVASLGEALESALALTRRKADEAHVNIVTSGLPAEDVRVRGRASELARALRNLIDNAIAHSTSESAVHVTLSCDAEHVSIIVADEGPGVTSDDASRIFEPFFRSSQDQAHADLGAGLGLPIAREIVQRNGGSLVLESHGGPGASFVMTLPAVAS